MSLHTHTFNQTAYNQIQINPNSKLWTGFYLLLAVIVGAETLTMFALFHTYSRELDTTRDFLHQDLLPVECLHEGVDPAAHLDADRTGGCTTLIQVLLKSAEKRLLMDVRDSLWRNLEERNVTRMFGAAVHVGVRPKQNRDPQETGPFQADVATLERLNWASLGGQSTQEGPIRLDPETELVVQQTGIYFVYSQVQFQTSGAGFAPENTHCLMRKRESHPEPTVLSRAAAAPPRHSGYGTRLYTSHQGALFQLQRGDRLSVFVSKKAAVRFTPQATYFGAFRVV